MWQSVVLSLVVDIAVALITKPSKQERKYKRKTKTDETDTNGHVDKINEK
jgi:hypothetical protein